MSGLKFYPASHRYKLDGAWVPGVTTILGVLDKPAIPKWAAGQVAEYVADNPDAIEHLRQMGRGPMVQALKGVPWEKRDRAAARGTTIHDYAERILRGEDVEVDDELVPVIENALAFLDEWHIEPLVIEAPVASREHRYAGTLDIVARYTHPATGVSAVAVWDWKSGRAFPEHAMQITAYGHAEFALVDGQETPIPIADDGFVVQVRADGYDVYPVEYGPTVFDEFLVIREAFDIAKRMRGNWKVPGSGYIGVAEQWHEAVAS